MVTRIKTALFLLLCALILCACAPKGEPAEQTGQIYLYGEAHSDERCLEKELAIWGEFYASGMRDLFVEHPCYTAEYLNAWMHADSDEILMRLYEDWSGTQAHSEKVLNFYREIKRSFPETVFHGTDVGHQYSSTGARYLSELRKAGRVESPEYELAQTAVQQGRSYYSKGEPDRYAYREDLMTENFIREYERLGGSSVMGIYGSMHTDPERLDFSETVPSMAAQLSARFGGALHTEDLTLADPVRTDRIVVNGKEYEATCFGTQDLSDSGLPYTQREYWRLENAYEDLKDCPLNGDVLPYNNYVMKVELGQVFVIDYTGLDGQVTRLFYRSDGYVWNGLSSTQGFDPEDRSRLP